MKNNFSLFFVIMLFAFINISGQKTFSQLDDVIKDFDGNEYHQIKLGTQVWLKEHLNSLHYSDGTLIPGVVAYNNDENLAKTFGRLYTWDAAMKNSTQEKAQGACPTSFHVASDAEWNELENYLGGATIAGGKMKDATSTYWKAPNTGADNSSGLGILPAGEYDSYYSPNKFQMLYEYAVIWTSTQTTSTKARERYLAYNNSGSLIYDWYKIMKYSARCVKDESATDVKKKDNQIPGGFELKQNFPNPFNPSTTIHYQIPFSCFVSILIYDVLGQKIFTLVNEVQNAGLHNINFDTSNLSIASGVYYCKMETGDYSATSKIVMMK